MSGRVPLFRGGNSLFGLGARACRTNLAEAQSQGNPVIQVLLVSSRGPSPAMCCCPSGETGDKALCVWPQRLYGGRWEHIPA
jgi:hypothetical protein